MAKVFVAQKEGKCAKCGKEMKGTRIAMDSKTNQYCHADCIWAKKSNAASNVSSQLREGLPAQGSGHLEDTNPSLPADEQKLLFLESEKKKVEEAVAENMAYAIKFTQETFKLDFEEIKEDKAYITFLLEVANERHALLLSEKIQQNKEKNMGTI